MRKLEFEYFRWVELSNERFVSLLRSIEKSKLIRSALGKIGNDWQLERVTRSIPNMKVRELKIDVHYAQFEVNAEQNRQNLLGAIKSNFTLRSVTVEYRGNLFNHEHERRLLFYAFQNERLDHFVEGPEKVDRKVWSEALSLAEQAGKDALFTNMQSVLGSDYVNLRVNGKRKRKQTQHYVPS